jgi:Zn-dependent M28 family amino/carboxypeptidase
MAASVVSVIELSETVNVVGRLTGWGHNPNESVLIGGHYDHLGIGTPVEGDSIYNGAVDNASGTAAVIAAAEAFMTSGVRPDRSILFMAFGAEESGLLGSKAFAARPTLPLRDLAAVINLDEMNLYGPTNDVSALGVNQSSLGDAFTAAARAEKLDVTVNPDAIRKGFFFRSDHFPFVLAGVPALSLQFGQDYVGRDPGWGAHMDAEYGERRYHQPGDELLTWYTLDGAMQQLRVMLRTALKVANASDQPTWNEGSEFKAAGDARLQQ